LEGDFLNQPARPCIWMGAGLLRYRLCDREFDCERCPLDAALRGESAWPERDAPQAAQARRALEFPAGRRYTSGHCWVQRQERGPMRIGLDAMAAALAGPPITVHAGAGAGSVRRGQPVLELSLSCGRLPLAAPAAGRGARVNPALEREPRLVFDDPYGQGWLYELWAREAACPRLCDATAALDQARLDLRHFRREAALALLCDRDGVGATMQDGGESLTDLRRMLAPQRYLALVRELVH
jgi:glycine cleavage system H protein